MLKALSLPVCVCVDLPGDWEGGDCPAAGSRWVWQCATVTSTLRGLREELESAASPGHRARLDRKTKQGNRKFTVATSPPG